jgi:nucleotide-binding universal stress UspA family protein
MDKILVPSDGSKHSRKTLVTAIEYAKKSSASITLIHVNQLITPKIIGISDEIDYVNPADEINRYAEAELEKAQKEVEKAGIKVNSVILKGSPGHRIVKYAKENNYDLIMIGNRGHSSLEEILLGSVCHYVVNHAESSVLVVK